MRSTHSGVRERLYVQIMQIIPEVLKICKKYCAKDIVHYCVRRALERYMTCAYLRTTLFTFCIALKNSGIKLFIKLLEEAIDLAQDTRRRLISEHVG